MGYWNRLQAILVFGPILGLLALGLVITLKSGVVSLTTHQGLACFASNLSQLLLCLVGYGVSLLALQQLIGVPLELVW